MPVLVQLISEPHKITWTTSKRQKDKGEKEHDDEEKVYKQLENETKRVYSYFSNRNRLIHADGSGFILH